MEGLILGQIITVTCVAAVLTLRAVGVRIRRPVLTLTVAAVTLAVSVTGELVPTVLDLLRRDGSGLAAGEWWRLVTPLLVQDGGWIGTIFNTTALLIVGGLTESLLSRRVWALAYIVSGLAGEVAAYTVMPHQGFAGNSIAVLGLAATAAVLVLIRGPWLARILGVGSLGLGIGLLFAGNLHGVGFCAGMAVGAIVAVTGSRATKSP